MSPIDAKRRLAIRMDAERRVLERKGVRATSTFIIALRRKIVRGFRKEGVTAIEPTVNGSIQPLATLLADGMTAAHVQGVLRSRITAAAHRHQRLNRGFLASVYDATIEALKERALMPNEEIRNIQQLYGPAAFAISKQWSGQVVREVNAAVAEALTQGLEGRAATNFLRQRLATSLPHTSNAGLEALFRTQTQIAYSVGRQRANAEPEVDDILWGYQYVTIGDDRVRPNHEALDDSRLPKDDPRWRTIFPPNGWNCRCTVVEIYKDEKLATERSPRPSVKDENDNLVVGGPDKGWGINHSDVFNLPISERQMNIDVLPDVSDATRKEVTQAMNSLPPRMRRIIDKSGVTVTVARTADQAREIIGGPMFDQYGDGSIEGQTGIYNHAQKRLIVFERFNIGDDEILNRSPLHSAIHEFGHLLDFNASGFRRLSTTTKFQDAWKADVAQISEADRSSLSRFVDKSIGRDEAFAEAVVLSLDRDRRDREVFREAFPNVMRVVNEIVEAQR